MTTMYWIRPVLVILVAMWAEGCGRSTVPVRDSTPPKIVLTALGAVGNPTFSSDEPVQRKDACAKFRSFPARFVLSVEDSGGVAMATIRVASGRILPESIIVGPDAPESSWEITRLEGFSELLIIQLKRPGAGAARTGLLGMFNVVPDSLPASILASAYDYSRNMANLYQVEVRANNNDAVVCR